MYAPVAQWIEQLVAVQQVGGSTPFKRASLQGWQVHLFLITTNFTQKSQICSILKILSAKNTDFHIVNRLSYKKCFYYLFSYLKPVQNILSDFSARIPKIGTFEIFGFGCVRISRGFDSLQARQFTRWQVHLFLIQPIFNKKSQICSILEILPAKNTDFHIVNSFLHINTVLLLFNIFTIL